MAYCVMAMSSKERRYQTLLFHVLETLQATRDKEIALLCPYKLSEFSVRSCAESFWEIRILLVVTYTIKFTASRNLIFPVPPKTQNNHCILLNVCKPCFHLEIVASM